MKKKLVFLVVGTADKSAKDIDISTKSQDRCEKRIGITLNREDFFTTLEYIRVDQMMIPTVLHWGRKLIMSQVNSD